MPKAVAVVDGSKDIHFIDRMTGEKVNLISEFIVEEAGPVHFVHCDRCGKRVRLPLWVFSSIFNALLFFKATFLSSTRLRNMLALHLQCSRCFTMLKMFGFEHEVIILLGGRVNTLIMHDVFDRFVI